MIGRVPAPWFVLKPAPWPWGDYGSILIGGMTGHLPRSDSGLLQLERTGPFVPPISFSGDWIVMSSFRAQLEGSGLTGLSFRPVVKARIVRLDWHTWDRSLSEPVEYPVGGEPENYILERPHDPGLADAMGELWQLVVPGIRAETPDLDFVRATADTLPILVSENARRWLLVAAGEWVSFRDTHF
jgi:hypothetical protein